MRKSGLLEVIAKHWRCSPVIADHEPKVDGSQCSGKRNRTPFDYGADSIDQRNCWRRIERGFNSIYGECTSEVPPQHRILETPDPSSDDESIPGRSIGYR
jgi:hypothetical protein